MKNNYYPLKEIFIFSESFIFLSKNLLSEFRILFDATNTKNKVIKDIVYRKAEFTNSLSLFLDKNPNKYSKDMYHAFFEYWTEHGENDKKMRFEKERSFGIKRRLGTWQRNERKFGNEHNLSAKEKMKVKLGSQSLDDILKNKL